MAATPELTITDGTTRIDLLGPTSGWKLADPYWNPQIAQYKGGGTLVNAQLAEGQRLVHSEYGNVIETIPLSMRGSDQAKAMKTAQEVLILLKQAGDYWAKPYEFNRVWIEVKLPCGACLTGYSTIVKGNIPELTNPFGQPFFSTSSEAIMEGINVIIEREPFWQLTVPGEIMGPIYNLIDNADFEIWNFGVVDRQPDNWNDLETTHITGQNSRDQLVPKFGSAALKVKITGSTLAGAAKGVSQTLNDVKNNAEYTVVAWVRSEGVTNGVGRILINFSSQLELYRDSISHGWTLHTGKITTSTNDTVSIDIEILTTSANTVGTIYVDSIMFFEGDLEQEAIDNILPYLSNSHVVNHWAQAESGVITAGELNYVDVYNIPGSVDSLIRLEFINNTVPADQETPVEIYKTIRIGMKRSNDVLNFQNFHDPAGGTDTTASTNNRLTTIALVPSSTEITADLFIGSVDTLDNQGRFRALARVYDPQSSGDSTLQTQLQFFIGASNTNNKLLDYVSSPIIGDWAILDLTNTAVVDFLKKFSTDTPGQFGYSINMKRATGSDVARFDYLMLMPTDGGFMTTTFNPSLAFNNVLSIDSRNNSVETAILPQQGWTTEFIDSTGVVPLDFETFKGELYACGGTGVGGEAKIFRRRSGKWSQVFLSSQSTNFQQLEVYDGKLYAGLNGTGADTFSSTNGDEWATAFNTGVQDWSMIAFNGDLWIGGGAFVNFAEIHKWDGSVLTQNFAPPGGEDFFYSLEIYNQRLYSGTNTGLIYEYTPATDSWALSFNTGTAADLFKMEVFNDKLYAMNSAGVSTNVYRFDGSSWSTVATGLNYTVPRTIFSFNGLLYMGGTSASDLQGILQSVDGETWTSVPDTEGLDANALNDFEGKLYAGITNALDETDAAIISLATTTVQGTIPTFKGTTFLAPSRTRVSEKRHRYVFSYDREDFINNKDDKGLVGIGFVPRYLELPIKEN